MNTAIKLLLAAAAGFVGGLVADLVRPRKELPQEVTPKDQLLLADASHVAARHALTSLQERPAFAVDDDERPYAMLYDTDAAGRGPIVSKPALLEEPQADSAS